MIYELADDVETGEMKKKKVAEKLFINCVCERRGGSKHQI